MQQKKEKVRIFALARELDMETKDLLVLCQQNGLDVKNQLSTIEPEVRDQILQLVKRGSTIGANATIVCGITLGEYAFIGAGAVVTADVPAYGLMVGVPARRVGWMCQCGVRLDLSRELSRDERATCVACGARYVKEKGSVTEAV